MKNLLFTILLIINSLFATATTQTETNIDMSETMTSGISVDFNSKYLWRGIEYNRGLILQPTLWLNYADFTFEIWSSYTLIEVNKAQKRNELDLEISYEYQIGSLTISPLFSFYYYPDQPDSPPTGELGLNLSFQHKNIRFFNNLTYDVIKYQGAYFNELGVSTEKEITRNLLINTSLSLGYASKTFNETYIELEEQTDFTHGPTFGPVIFDFTIKYFFYEEFYISPHFQYNFIVDKSLEKVLGSNNNFFGVQIGVEF